MEENVWELICKTHEEIRIVEESFRKIQENPAQHGTENALTRNQLQLLEKLIAVCDEVVIAGNEICNRALG
jgi:hypothetical protein